MALPPLPPGATLLGSPPPRRDPYETLKSEGFVFSNGFRADGDDDRIRAQGYNPAPNSAHKVGDGVDLTHPTLTPAQQAQRLSEVFGDWEGHQVIDEGHHRHLKLPGWGEAPGTPNTPHSGLPPLPDGAALIQRGSIQGQDLDETQARIATIRQNGFPPDEEARLIQNIQNETQAPLVDASDRIGAFNDELPEEVLTKLKPEQIADWYKLARDPRSTAADLEAKAQSFGFGLANAAEIVEARQKGLGVNDNPIYKRPDPIDLGDGATGAAGRGFADPFNVLDEMGGVVDTLGLTNGRENIWNSDRSFKDVLYGNIDTNRAILEGDAENHFLARTGGQLASGLLLPIGNKAQTAKQLAKWGAAEGAAAGFGAGEGNPLQRAPNAVVGAGIGTVGGYAIGRVAEDLGIPAYRALRARLKANGIPEEEIDDVIRRATVGDAAPVVNDGVQNAGPTPAARTQPSGGAIDAARGSQAMASDIEAPTLTGRVVDRIDVNALPPLPPGASLIDEPMLGGIRPMNQRLGSEEIADLARGVNPEDVTPIPPNTVGSLEEFDAATGGVQRQIPAPNPADELEMRNLAGRNRRGPADLVTWIRSQPWALKDEAGELSSYGIDNTARRGVDFAGGENFLGKLVDNANGRSLDEAAEAAWEAGYFPHHTARPPVSDFLEALSDTHRGVNRAFRPDDLDEVGRFAAATADRQMIESAAQEGRPLYEDIGETVNLDDLAALDPPTGAYEDAPRLVGKIGNINLAHIESPADVSRLIQHVQSRVGGFDAAARGKITHEETRRLAIETGHKPEDFLKRRQGQALNAEQLYGLRMTIQASRQVVARLAQRAIGGSDDDVAAFRNAWMRHVAIEEHGAAATAEAGRALSQFRMLSRAGDAKGAAVKAYLRGGGGREPIEKAAEALVEMMKDPAAASKFMRDAAKVRKTDMINELWVNSLLSGIRTHVVNFVSNAFTAAYQIPEQGLTAAIGAVLRTPDRVTAREVGARAVGLLQGAQEGVRLMKHAWKTGEPLDAVSKVEARNYQAIPGRVGEIIRTPTRGLTAADELWKSINRRAATNAMAYRRAYGGSGTAEEKAQRFADLVGDPDKPLRDYADKQARYYTFQAELGEFGQSLQRGANSNVVAKLIIPFVRTPVNLLKFAGERSVFAPLVREFREAIAKGGNDRNEAVARLTLGSGLSGWAVAAATEGRISGGGPSDSREKAALLNSGWQPYSIKVGDSWVSFARFEPFAMLIGAAADFTDVVAGGQATPKETDEMALALSVATAKNITSKTWLSGLSDFFEVLSDPERYGKNYIERMLGSMAVPAISAHAAGATDPYLREVNGVLDAIKNRVPGLSHDLQERLNVWGEPIKRGSGAGQGVAGAAYNFVSPVYTSAANNDPVLAEAARLRAAISMPQRSITIDGERVKLTPDQYHYYVQLSGKPAKQHFDEYMQSPEWQEMDDEQRREYVNDTMKEFRATAREEVKAMFPNLAPSSQIAPPPLPPGATLVE